jgi:hypothetical protein
MLSLQSDVATRVFRFLNPYFLSVLDMFSINISFGKALGNTEAILIVHGFIVQKYENDTQNVLGDFCTSFSTDVSDHGIGTNLLSPVNSKAHRMDSFSCPACICSIKAPP